MRYTIPKDKHRVRPLTFGLWIGKSEIRKKVCFNKSCEYDLPGEDQWDTNKLFGIGYLFNHHVDSARFGWLWNPAKRKIELSAYCYVRGMRIIQTICDVDTKREYELLLRVFSDKYVFVVSSEGATIGACSIPYSHKKKLAYPLGIFFGGSRKAPHSMTIEMKNV